ISTLMDLRKVEKNDWKHVVFHRYGMMKEGDTMEIIAKEEPKEIYNIFASKFSGEHTWKYQKKEVGEYVVHVTKQKTEVPSFDSAVLVKEFDARPFPPAKRHDMVFNAFDELKPGEAFIFINDHDPKPLYYQIEAESNQPFKWDYLVSGPEEWKVKVSKTLEK
ncbi:MAG: DUF2249 domain-containing protein, partial [Bacteroidia bacterium]|nr:DUF2249 domain-containing protein [Bacteroidia bacterium]